MECGGHPAPAGAQLRRLNRPRPIAHAGRLRDRCPGSVFLGPVDSIGADRRGHCARPPPDQLARGRKRGVLVVPWRQPGHGRLAGRGRAMDRGLFRAAGAARADVDGGRTAGVRRRRGGPDRLAHPRARHQAADCRRSHRLAGVWRVRDRRRAGRCGRLGNRPPAGLGKSRQQRRIMGRQRLAADHPLALRDPARIAPFQRALERLERARHRLYQRLRAGRRQASRDGRPRLLQSCPGHPAIAGQCRGDDPRPGGAADLCRSQ